MFKKFYKTKGCRRFLALLLAGVLTVSGADMLTVSASAASEVNTEMSETDVTDVDAVATVTDPVTDTAPASETTQVTDPTESPATTPTTEPTEVPEATPEAEPTEVPETTPTVEPTESPEATPAAEPTESPATGGVSPTSLDEGIATVADEEGVHTLDATALQTFDSGKSDGDTTSVGDYFTIIWGAKAKVEGGKNAKFSTYDSSEADVSGANRIHFNERAVLGATDAGSKAVIKFTTSAAATVKVYWVAGDANRPLYIKKNADDAGLKETGEKDGTTLAKNGPCVSTFTLNDANTYYLGSFDGNNYIFKVIVTEETGPAQDVSVTPTITGLAEGQEVYLVKGGDETKITSGTAATLKTGTYDLIVKENGTTNENVRATVEGKTSVTIKEDTTAFAVSVASAYVNPTVELAEGSLALAEGNSLTLKAKSDDSTISLAVGSAVKLTIDETYTLETAEGSKTKATVDGKTEFKAADGMTELSVMLESTVVTAKVTIFDPDNVKGQITALNLMSGKTVAADLLTAASVELTIGESYAVEISGADDVTVSINGGSSVKAGKDTTELKVLLGKITEGLYVFDLTQGLYKDKTYDGGISVMADMPYKDGGFVKGSVNPKNEANETPKGEVPVLGTVLVLNAQQDGRLKISVNKAAGKTFYFVTDGGVKGSFIPNTATTVSYKVEEGETYYFYGSGSNMEISSLTVDYRPAVDWSTVDAPVLKDVVATNPGDADEGTVTVNFAAQVGGVYSDSLDIRVYKGNELIDTVTVTDETSILDGYAGSAVVVPAASGDYTFQALLKRSGESAKLSNKVSITGFKLPMATPVIVNAESQGSGNVKFSWQAVPEAVTYNVYLNGALKGTTSDLYYRFSGLTAGTEYEFAVEAVGNGDVSERAVQKATVTGEAKKNWLFSAFGQGVSTKSSECGYSGSIETGDLKLWDVNSKGKLVPASTDGLSFYYTTIDPETENFTLTADVVVDSWTYTNGQEGFGLMAADNVGVHGDSSVFWNNSYMLSATKVEYTWDPELKELSDGGTKYAMRLGIGAQEKTGVTPENLSSMQDGSGIADFITNMYTLETSAAQTLVDADTDTYLPSGSYNIVGNHQEKFEYPTTSAGEQTVFHMVLQRNNTGYFLSYTDQNGVTTTKKFYHGDDGDELAKLDPNNIYVGFFASRTASISIQNATLTTVAPEDDAPAEVRPIEYVTPSVGFESANVANSRQYDLVYYGNADGRLRIECGCGDVITDYIDVKANTKYHFTAWLHSGNTLLQGYFQPDASYKPSKYAQLSSYAAIEFNINVKYNRSDRNIYYVSPEHPYWGTGAKDNPVDIYTAIQKAAPGDTIVLMEGTYSLSRTLTIDRGMDGRADAKIYMIADPEAATRPVLDFNQACAGMIMAGDYWYFQGFDVTRSAAGDKGIQVSGSYNTLDNLRTYRNGNTGLQISRYKGSDLWEDWPSHNLILNCTSYLNADPGYEDADGFAAKLTIADGNVFDGCIAAYNADDGWDLFAKIESGPIGRVEIRNSVAFKNGYVVGEDGKEISAGNGNGFKMGGSSITGYHTLINSVAFGNKAKGIDSNSCPDIQVYNSISFNNEANNVAFYTNDAKNTDFFADGIISYKTPDVGEKAYKTGENFKLLGTQDESKVRGKTNYYWSGSKSTNTNKVLAADNWFVNMDMDAAIHGGICRNADGTINMNGFLVLTDAAPADAGARLAGAGTASEKVVMPALVVSGSDDEDDSVGGGAAGGSAAGGAEAVIAEVNWNTVAVNVDTAKAQQNVDVQTGDRFEVPVSVLSKVAGKDVTLALHAGDGIAFSISGRNVKKATAPFKVTLSHASVIPASVANQVLAGAEDSRMFSMAEKTAYPYLVNVHLNLGVNNAGKMAYLYYYDEKSNSMKLSGTFRITSNGQAMFAITRGDEYIVTVGGRAAAASGRYIVVNGDTLSAIATKTGVTLKRLIEANPQIQNIHKIYTGQEIILP